MAHVGANGYGVPSTGPPDDVHVHVDDARHEYDDVHVLKLHEYAHENVFLSDAAIHLSP